MSIGIYKITSPTNNIYIGQSWNIPIRWKNHKRKGYLKTPIGFSINVHGHEKHSFEVIHELPKDISQDVLDSYEQLYIDLYKDAGFHLLNAKGAGRSGKLPADVIAKIRDSNKGQKRSQEFKDLLSKIKIGNKGGYGNRGKVRTAETKLKISNTLKNKNVSNV